MPDTVLRIMQDTKLTIEAKAIYCYLNECKKNKISIKTCEICNDLKISKDRFYSHMKLLKQYGYIKINHTRDKGKFLKNVYELGE